MIDDFLRPPRGAGELLADLVRVAGLVSIAAAGLGWTATDAGILAFALPALLLPRFVGARVGFDIAYCVTVLVAAWSNVLGLYESVASWDLVVHFAATGMIAAMVLLLLRRWHIVASPSARARRIPLVIVPLIGLAISALWEIVEWIGYSFISEEIFVAYEDTIGDMFFGALGAAVAGVVAAFTRLDRAGA